jgi:hypothetical protein
MKIKDILGKNSPPSPIGFDKEQESLWILPFWRDDYCKRLSKKRRSILLSFLRINSIAILLSILVATLIYFKTNITITENSMLTLSISIVTASAAILTIIIAFLTYLLGNSINNMQGVKSRIGDELIILEDIKEKIEPFTNGPKDSVEEPLRGKVIELVKKTKIFSNALKAISGRFHRAGSSTYYDDTDLFTLNSVIKDTGGNWFKDYVTTFQGYENHDFAKNTWIRAIDVSQRLCNLNNQAMAANKQLDQVVLFIPLLASVLFTFILALFVSFISGVGYGNGSEGILLPITKLFLSITLVILLPVQLIGIVKHLWSLFLSKHVADETRRFYDTKVSKDIENKYSFDYLGALKKEADIFLKMNDTDKKTP